MTIIKHMVVMMTRGIRSAALVLAWVVMAGLGGCADNGESGRNTDVEPETAADRAGITATLQRSTLFETRRSLRLTVRSDRGEEREIGAIQLESPLFEPVEPEARDAHLPPAGRPVVMPLPFGTVRCDHRNASGDAASPHTLAVSNDRPSASAPITITASRCDPHALIEYKRTFIFTASIQMDSAEPARVDIKAEGAARRALEDLLTSCLG